MNDFSLVEKLNILMNMILSSPLFLFCFLIAIVVLILFVLNLKNGNKKNNLIFIFIWLVLGIVLIIYYNSIVLKLIDSLLDGIFKVLYFPNMPIYIVLLFITNFFFIYSLINKKVSKKYKILNFIHALIADLFLIFIMNIINNNIINIYNEIDIYTNTNLLVLLQLNSAVFISWILITLLLSAQSKLKKYDKKELPPMPEVVFYESE